MNNLPDREVVSRTQLDDGIFLVRVINNAGFPFSTIVIDGVEMYSCSSEREEAMLKWWEEEGKKDYVKNIPSESGKCPMCNADGCCIPVKEDCEEISPKLCGMLQAAYNCGKDDLASEISDILEPVVKEIEEKGGEQ